MDQKKTQCNDVLKYLKEHGSITIYEAVYKLGITRLGARIWDLKRQGYMFSSELVEVTKRDGTKTRVKQYTLLDEVAA